MMPLQTATLDMFNVDQNIDALIVLHNRSVDALTGYHKMVEKAEPSFRTVPEEFRALHAIQAERLARMLVERGCQVEPNGTILGTMNAVAVSMRALFETIDEGMLGSIQAGEIGVLAAFDTAIAADLGPANKLALVEMRADLVALLERYVPAA